MYYDMYYNDLYELNTPPSSYYNEYVDDDYVDINPLYLYEEYVDRCFTNAVEYISNYIIESVESIYYEDGEEDEGIIQKIINAVKKFFSKIMSAFKKDTEPKIKEIITKAEEAVKADPKLASKKISVDGKKMTVRDALAELKKSSNSTNRELKDALNTFMSNANDGNAQAEGNKAMANGKKIVNNKAKIAKTLAVACGIGIAISAYSNARDKRNKIYNLSNSNDIFNSNMKNELDICQSQLEREMYMLDRYKTILKQKKRDLKHEQDEFKANPNKMTGYARNRIQGLKEEIETYEDEVESTNDSIKKYQIKLDTLSKQLQNRNTMFKAKTDRIKSGYKFYGEHA